MYIILITETTHKRDEYEEVLKPFPLSRHDDITIEVYNKYRQMKGLRKGANRPHMVICDFTIENEKEYEWYIHCIRPMAYPYTIFIEPKMKLVNKNFYSERFERKE